MGGVGSGGGFAGFGFAGHMNGVGGGRFLGVWVHTIFGLCAPLLYGFK